MKKKISLKGKKKSIVPVIAVVLVVAVAASVLFMRSKAKGADCRKRKRKYNCCGNRNISQQCWNRCEDTSRH